MAISTLAPDIRDLKFRRLHELERQQAQQGYSTRPEIANEIRDLRTELGLAAAPATIAESHDILYDFMMKINARIDRLYWWMLMLAILIVLAVKL